MFDETGGRAMLDKTSGRTALDKTHGRTMLDKTGGRTRLEEYLLLAAFLFTIPANSFRDLGRGQSLPNVKQYACWNFGIIFWGALGNLISGKGAGFL